MSEDALSPTADRRTILFRLLGKTRPTPLTPDVRGRDLLDGLLLDRLRAVYVDAARPWPEDTEELVHDVRVASRRLVEVLALAAPLLGKKATKRAQRRAKALRQALGASREADVLVADFRRLAEAAGMAEETVHALDAMSEAGQGALDAARADYPPEWLLSEAVDILLRAVEPKSKASLRELAAPHLFSRVEAAAPLVESLADPEAAEAHHALRIRCKRIRYTVEAVAPVFPEVIDPKPTLASMKRLQDALGVLNDADDLLDWLERPFLKKEVGAATAKAVRALALEEKGRRYAAAREVVLAEAPDLFGGLRRCAGLIGHLPG